MKKILSILFAIFVCAGLNPAYSVEEIYSLEEVDTVSQNVSVNDNKKSENETLMAEVTFDWLDITQEQKEELISSFKSRLFDENTSKVYFTKDEFKKTFAQYFKDREYKYHYMLTNNGVTEDEDAKYCAFYYKKNTLVMYAIQYKNNPKNAFYYTAFGKMYYTDVMSEEYPNFPYTSMQYDRKGKLKSAIYFVSKDIQYMFGADKEFQGVWYKEKMYDKNGKVVLTRSNW